MQYGISIYPGLDNTHKENLMLLKKAAAKGFSRVFTSFHIPETNISSFKSELIELIQEANLLNMEIISDISPETLKILDIPTFSPKIFKNLGIKTIRIDYGFNIDEIAKLSRNRQNIRIQLNASTITPRIIDELKSAKTNFKNIDALHNFYPREGTGLSEKFFIEKTSMLQNVGIKVGAFIPSQSKRRSPLKEGLPTLEMHRKKSVSLAARHLAAIGIDSIIIADSLPSDNELDVLSQVNEDCVSLSSEMITTDVKIQKYLTSSTFSSRIDEAQDAIRSQESRQFIKNMQISVKPDNTKAKKIGSITIDNELYGRYMGELQILKCSKPAENRTNLVAQINESELFLLKYITPGRNFRFVFDTKKD